MRLILLICLISFSVSGRVQADTSNNNPAMRWLAPVSPTWMWAEQPFTLNIGYFSESTPACYISWVVTTYNAPIAKGEEKLAGLNTQNLPIKFSVTNIKKGEKISAEITARFSDCNGNALGQTTKNLIIASVDYGFQEYRSHKTKPLVYDPHGSLAKMLGDMKIDFEKLDGIENIHRMTSRVVIINGATIDSDNKLSRLLSSDIRTILINPQSFNISLQGTNSVFLAESIAKLLPISPAIPEIFQLEFGNNESSICLDKNNSGSFITIKKQDCFNIAMLQNGKGILLIYDMDLSGKWSNNPISGVALLEMIAFIENR